MTKDDVVRAMLAISDNPCAPPVLQDSLGCEHQPRRVLGEWLCRSCGRRLDEVCGHLKVRRG